MPVSDCCLSAGVDEVYRRGHNSRATAGDTMGHVVGCPVLVVLVVRLVAIGAAPQLLAAAAVALALATAVLLLIRLCPYVWLRWREVVLLAEFAVHYAIGNWIGVNEFSLVAPALQYSSGTSSCGLVVLLILMHSNSAFWQPLNALMYRSVLRCQIIGQPLLALVAFPWSGQLCKVVLDQPAGPVAVQQLYRSLDAAMRPLLARPLAAVGATPVAATDAADMCITVNMWGLIFLGAIVPLCLCLLLERQSRATFVENCWQGLAAGDRSSPLGKLLLLPGTNSALDPGDRAVLLDFLSHWQWQLEAEWGLALGAAAAVVAWPLLQAAVATGPEALAQGLTQGLFMLAVAP